MLRAAARGKRNRIETRSANGVAPRQSLQREPATPHGPMPFECLARIVSAAWYEPARAEAAGYTHLIGGAKQNPELMADLEARMRADYPEIAERCRALVSE